MRRKPEISKSVIVLHPGCLLFEPRSASRRQGGNAGTVMRELLVALRSGNAVSIESRLLRWGRVSRSGPDELSADDLREYELITKAWRRLLVPHREMIRMVYVWRAHREIVCRRLRIARSPPSIHDLALAAARCAFISEIRKQLADTDF